MGNHACHDDALTCSYSNNSVLSRNTKYLYLTVIKRRYMTIAMEQHISHTSENTSRKQSQKGECINSTEQTPGTSNSIVSRHSLIRSEALSKSLWFISNSPILKTQLFGYISLLLVHTLIYNYYILCRNTNFVSNREMD